MILVRHWGPEQGEDAVACRLDDVTVIAPHGFDHQLQRRIDDRARLFGVEVLHQLGRTLDVGEQRRHRLALALEIFRDGCLGYPNRSIVGFFRCDRSLSKCSRTFTTEVLAWLIRGTALRTRTR